MSGGLKRPISFKGVNNIILHLLMKGRSSINNKKLKYCKYCINHKKKKIPFISITLKLILNSTLRCDKCQKPLRIHDKWNDKNKGNNMSMGRIGLIVK